MITRMYLAGTILLLTKMGDSVSILSPDIPLPEGNDTYIETDPSFFPRVKFFDTKTVNEQGAPVKIKRTLGRSAPTCEALEWDQITINKGGIDTIAYIPTSPGSFDFYGAMCCCRSRGQYLASITNADELEAFNIATEDRGDISWVDGNTFTGAWKSYADGRDIEDSAFFNGEKPKIDIDTCQEMRNDRTLGAYGCAGRLEELFVCEERDNIKLSGDCFRQWDGGDKFAPCNKFSLIDHAKTKKCPVVGSKTYCDGLEFDKVNIDGGTRAGYITTAPATFSWSGATCCCRSRGQHLVSVKNQLEIGVLYSLTNSGEDVGPISWVDANTFTGEWKTFLTNSQIDSDIFVDNNIPENETEYCGSIVPVGNNSYQIMGIPCDSTLSRRLVCEERVEQLTDDCFHKWEGDERYTSCNKYSVMHYAVRGQNCPKTNSVTECLASDYSRVNITVDGRVIMGFHANDFTTFDWHGAFCCCRNLGLHLATINSEAEGKALWEALNKVGRLGWVDAHHYNRDGSWATVLNKEQIEPSQFVNETFANDAEEYCGDAVNYLDSEYKIQAIHCHTKIRETLFCEDREENLIDNCFGMWGGYDHDSTTTCSTQHIIKYIQEDFCPGTPTTKPPFFNGNDGNGTYGSYSGIGPAAENNPGFIENYYKRHATLYNFYGRKK